MIVRTFYFHQEASGLVMLTLFELNNIQHKCCCSAVPKGQLNAVPLPLKGIRGIL